MFKSVYSFICIYERRDDDRGNIIGFWACSSIYEITKSQYTLFATLLQRRRKKLFSFAIHGQRRQMQTHSSTLGQSDNEQSVSRRVGAIAKCNTTTEFHNRPEQGRRSYRYALCSNYGEQSRSSDVRNAGVSPAVSIFSRSLAVMKRLFCRKGKIYQLCN